MKSFALSTGALVIALMSGAGGYFLGKNQTAGSPPATAIMPLPGVISTAPVKRPNPLAIDPTVLRAALDAEKNPLVRYKLAMHNMESWVAKNPKDALNWLATQQPSERRDEVIRMALNQYSAIDAKGAADWTLKNLTGNDLNNTLISIATNWAQQAGSEAASWFLGLPPTVERDGAIENIFFTWASNEPAAALAFIKTHPELADQSPTLRRAALAGWSKSDPEAAVTASLDLSRTNNDPAQFANTLANWATLDLDSSSQWLLTNLTAGDTRTVAAQELATIFASQSPDAGVAWLEKLSPGGERDAAASALVAVWSKSGPAEAAKWATTQTSSTLAPEALGEIAHNFFMKDPAAFQTWRSTLPEGPMKTQASQVGVAAGDP